MTGSQPHPQAGRRMRRAVAGAATAMTLFTFGAALDGWAQVSGSAPNIDPSKFQPPQGGASQSTGGSGSAAGSASSNYTQGSGQASDGAVAPAPPPPAPYGCGKLQAPSVVVTVDLPASEHGCDHVVTVGWCEAPLTLLNSGGGAQRGGIQILRDATAPSRLLTDWARAWLNLTLTCTPGACGRLAGPLPDAGATETWSTPGAICITGPEVAEVQRLARAASQGYLDRFGLPAQEPSPESQITIPQDGGAQPLQ